MAGGLAGSPINVVRAKAVDLLILGESEVVFYRASGCIAMAGVSK